MIKKNNGKRRDRYVGSLDKVVEFYVSNGGVGVSPHSAAAGI
ncbi:putative integrase [Saccharolobus islandicus]|nr:putative integrase [Sulfolobus islandicus]